MTQAKSAERCNSLTDHEKHAVRERIAFDPTYAIADADTHGLLHEVDDDTRYIAIGRACVILTGLGARGWDIVKLPAPPTSNGGDHG